MKKYLALFALAALAASAQDTTNPQQTAYGAITTAGSGTDCSQAAACVLIATPFNTSAVSVQLSGTFSATLQLEESVGGTTWTSLSSPTAAGIYPVMLYGARYLRVRASAYVSGTVTVNLSATSSATSGFVVAQADATAQSANINYTTIYAVPAGAGGTYRISCYTVVTRAATSSSTLPACYVIWNDSDTGVTPFGLLSLMGTQTSNTVGTTGNSGGSGGAGTQLMQVQTGTNIQYKTSSYASSGATSMQYAVHVKLEFLGQ